MDKKPVKIPCYFNNISISGGYHNYPNFPNNVHMHLRACDATLSYHCLSPNTQSNIPE